MENSYKSYHGVMMEEVAAKVEARAEARGEARGEARAEKRRNLEIARNLVGKLGLSEIAQVTGLPLSVIEELRQTT